MGKKKPLKLAFFISFILVMFEYYNQIIDIVNYVVWFVYYNDNEVVRYILASGSVLSAVMLVKKIFFDTRQLINLQKELGKSALYDSLKVLHEVIKVYGTKETIKRIKLIDTTEYKMKSTAAELVNIIIQKDSLKPEFHLKFKDKFRLSKKILDLLKLIDKQMDINKIEENIKASNRKYERRQPVIDEYTEKRKLDLLKELEKN